MRLSKSETPNINTRKALLFRVLLLTAIYLGLSFFGGRTGWHLLYPIRIFVTFLHEFGHAAGAVLTGGKVLSVELLPGAGGGGATWSSGGFRPVVIMGGYLGSAIFGNILFYIAAKKPSWSKPVLGILIAAMVLTAVIWYKSVFTTAILFAYASALFFIGFKTRFGRDILMLLGIASVIYILQDTAIGPSGDLAQFEANMKFIPARGWMLIWFCVAAGFLALNLKLLLGAKPDEPLPRAIKTREFS